jgi:processive 1,2-diacylglycerol beta-glucosyltransferase
MHFQKESNGSEGHRPDRDETLTSLGFQAVVAEFRALRDEVQSRLEKQQEITSYGIAFVAALVVAFSFLRQPEFDFSHVGVVYPVISLILAGFTLMCADHDMNIAHIYSYVETVLRPQLAELTNLSAEQLHIWEWNKARAEWQQGGGWKRQIYAGAIPAGKYLMTITANLTLAIYVAVNGFEHPSALLVWYLVPLFIVMYSTIASIHISRLYFRMLKGNASAQDPPEWMASPRNIAVNHPPARRVLILYSATGHGHRSVAEAIRDSINGKSEVQCWDLEVFADLRPPLIGGWPSAYSWMARHLIWLYDILFRITDNYWFTWLVSKAIYRIAKRRIKNVLLDKFPDVVVVTAPFIGQIAAKAKEDLHLNFLIMNVVSDLVRPHASWICREAYATAICSLQAENRLVRGGLRQGIIFKTNLPVHSSFFKYDLSKENHRSGLAIRRDLFTILLSGGSLGSGPIFSAAKILAASFPEAQLLIVSGTNRRLYKSLLSFFGSDRYWIREFVKDMAVPLGASDVVVCKGGPSSIMEAAAVGRPVVVLAEVGLQEKGNGKFAQDIGVGYEAKSLSDVVAIVDSIKRELEVNGLQIRHRYTTNGADEIAGLIIGRQMPSDIGIRQSSDSV